MHIRHKKGFTLVEIMTVVGIIGLLSAMLFPAVLHAGDRARARTFAKEIQTAGHAFVEYACEHGNYPADRGPAQMPEGMADYLKKFSWTKATVVGGSWDWDYQQFGIFAGVSVYMPSWDDTKMVQIDQVIDDGNLSTGQFRKRSAGYIFIIEE